MALNGGEKWPYTEFQISLMAHRKILKHPSPSTESASRLFGSLLLARGQTQRMKKKNSPLGH